MAGFSTFFKPKRESLDAVLAGTPWAPGTPMLKVWLPFVMTLKRFDQDVLVDAGLGGLAYSCDSVFMWAVRADGQRTSASVFVEIHDVCLAGALAAAKLAESAPEARGMAEGFEPQRILVLSAPGRRGQRPTLNVDVHKVLALHGLDAYGGVVEVTTDIGLWACPPPL